MLYSAWTQDAICDSTCNVAGDCNYDNGYCYDCDGICYSVYNIFELVGGVSDPQEIVTIDEVCGSWQ